MELKKDIFDNGAGGESATIMDMELLIQIMWKTDIQRWELLVNGSNKLYKYGAGGDVVYYKDDGSCW